MLETTITGYILYRDNGKENGNYNIRTWYTLNNIVVAMAENTDSTIL